MLTYFLCFYAGPGNEFAFTVDKLFIYLLFVVVGAHTGSMQVNVECVGAKKGMGYE